MSEQKTKPLWPFLVVTIAVLLYGFWEPIKNRFDTTYESEWTKEKLAAVKNDADSLDRLKKVVSNCRQLDSNDASEKFCRRSKRALEEITEMMLLEDLARSKVQFDALVLRTNKERGTEPNQ